MPVISRFLGIVIMMYYGDHEPPHFHVKYNEYRAAIDIESLKLIQGKLPPKALGLVVEWASIHQKELLEDWQLAKNLDKIRPIAPLE